jgi:hypothetical protein
MDAGMQTPGWIAADAAETARATWAGVESRSARDGQPAGASSQASVRLPDDLRTRLGVPGVPEGQVAQGTWIRGEQAEPASIPVDLRALLRTPRLQDLAREAASPTAAHGSLQQDTVGMVSSQLRTDRSHMLELTDASMAEATAALRLTDLVVRQLGEAVHIQLNGGSAVRICPPDA